MATFVSRRAASRRAEPTQQLIAFRIQQEWFALPIQVAHRVIPLEQLYGAAQGGEVSLTHYQDREISVIDVSRRIFGQPPRQNLLPGFASGEPLQPPLETQVQPRSLLIIQCAQVELIGIPLDSPPMLHRVPKSAFAPLPAAYLLEGKIRCVSALVTVSSDRPPLFFLNLDQLFQAESHLLTGQTQDEIASQAKLIGDVG
jgi:chemotaxis signal transduction protein